MLTDTKLRNLKPEAKRYRVADKDGLYLDILPHGKRFWLFRYTLNGKRRWLSLGEYPMLSLREAREIRDAKRRALFDCVPLEEKLCTTGNDQPVHSFGAVALEWLAGLEQRLTSEKEKQTARGRIINHVLPFLGDRPINDIKPVDVLNVIRRLEARGTLELAHRVYQSCGRIFRYAVAAGICERDPAADIKDAILPVPQRHFASITDKAEVGALMRAIDQYPGAIVRMAMLLSAYTFCRPGEIRRAEWSEINGDEWRIASEKMKMRRPHIVPLSDQALAVLEKAKVISGSGRYVFPSARTPDGSRPLSETAVLVALRSMGYGKDQMTAHGFRSMASTLLNENGFPPDHIERQLAHIEGNSVRAAYNYAEYLPERRRMMQWWADYLDELRARF